MKPGSSYFLPTRQAVARDKQQHISSTIKPPATISPLIVGLSFSPAKDHGGLHIEPTLRGRVGCQCNADRHDGAQT